MKEYTEKYTKSPKIGGILIMNYFKSLNNLLKYVPSEYLNGEEVLEVGCGAGFSTERLLGMLPKGTKFVASDFEQENVVDAREKLGSTVEVRKESVYELDRGDSSISLIFVLEVMEHLEFPTKALRELHRVSKKYLILGVPNEPLWRILNLARGKYIKDLGNTPGHIQHWSTYSFKRMLELNGFRVLKIVCPLPWSLVLVEKI